MPGRSRAWRSGCRLVFASGSSRARPEVNQRAAARILTALLLAACTGPAAAPPSPLTAAPSATVESSPSLAAATPSPEPTATPRTHPPAVASDPDTLALQIVEAERAVRNQSVSGADLAWFGHLQQLTYRRLAARPEWHDAVLGALPAEMRVTATANADATADLRATVVPGPDLPTAWRIVDPAPLSDLNRYYREAETEFGVSWAYLAAIHLVETRMGRIRGTSIAGAQGPMQFMPATWKVWGEGDVDSDRDAIRAAARYLRANGAPGNMAGALFRYNQSQRYVRAVTAYAEVMRADPDAFRGYYHWQVYYLTTRGDIWLPVGYGR
ncbi:MAG: lytic transglycosylase domain-containing protein [Chloroflexi bacterium]|nr:MAG: lytic transglycosylase domain-containing protein [Chloroflexota bacterium]